MNVIKDRGVLIFSHDERGIAKYDLKTGNMFREKNGKESQAKSLTLFFRGYNIDRAFSNINDEKFIDFMKYVNKKENTCYSVGTFLSRMGKYIKAEPFHKLGINLRDNVYLSNVDMKLIPKDIIRILINVCSDGNCKIENVFFRIVNSENRDVYFNMIRHMNMKHDISSVKSFIRLNVWRFEQMIEFIKEYNYDYKSFVDYIVYIKEIEGIRFGGSLGYLKDYYSQSLAMARNKKSVEKYPKFLRSKHDIISSHYNLFKEQYSEEIFAEMYINTNLEYEDNGNFIVIYPKDTDDMKLEGRELSHCVKSYINKVIDGETLVVFIRNKKEIDERLLTMEIQNDTIYQVKGLLNRNPSADEMKFIKKYAKTKELKISKYIGG